MLWYLLYPIRGTTQPPRLSANHPIRKAFWRHGKTTAQYWMVAMLVTVAIAMGFSYPTVLLAENPTAGFAAYPHHVWTTAKPYDGNPNDADVEMRQVWVHGSYMRALDKDVLKSALDIQQTLVGGEPLTAIFPGLGEKLRSSTLSWGFHSPLMYWNNSEQMIENDEDILETVNEQARTAASSLNVALRPASVFAGKKFDRRKLTAADALVITLMNKVEDSVGGQWEEKMTSLTSGCENCTLFPTDGHVTRNRIYEFSFTPLTWQESFAFAIAYGLMGLYVLLSLWRLKAFHSRFGLVVTAITQMTCSILASFTICGMLEINLSMMPQNAYPFVVLVMGIENMFRLINAVLAYPATMATDIRIANALGDVGPVSVATAFQNITILSILARLVSPGVAAFCAFACIATLFDAFFLLTFFVAVLNVDIRRFELQDALARANQSRPRRRPSPAHHHTWFDALVHGQLPFSTRMAGTAVTTTFILSLNYHFFEHKEKAMSLRHLLRQLKTGPPTLSEFDTFTPPPINASLTPGQWMRMQDFDTAKEVMRLAKPGADSFIVRVFAPLIVVLSGADRNDIEQSEAWTSALRSLVIDHFYPVTVAIVFAVTFVAVLMNFLLYTEQDDDSNSSDEDEAVNVQTVALPHKLDIIKLVGNEKGHFVSVALDRTIAISLLDRTQQSRRILCLTMDSLLKIQWPLHRITLDDSGEWMACHSADDRVLLYCSALNSFATAGLQYPDDNPPLLFQFVRLPSADNSKLFFIVLTSGGRFAMMNVENTEMKTMTLADNPLLGASLMDVPNQGRRLVVMTDQAKLLYYSWNSDDWNPIGSQSLPVPMDHGRLAGATRIEQHSEASYSLLVITTPKCVVFLDNSSLSFLGTMEAQEGEPAINNIMFGQSAACSSCGSLPFKHIAMVGEAAGDIELTVTTLSPSGGDDAVICLSKSKTSCQSFDSAHRTPRCLSKAGAWSVVTSKAVLGLRKQVQSNESRPKTSDSTRLRRRQKSRSPAKQDHGEDVWEAYRISVDGELDTVEVASTTAAEAEMGSTALYVSSAGPAVPLDSQSIAVAFGNTVKVIRSMGRGPGSRRPTGRSLERRPEVSINGSAAAHKAR